MKVLGLNRVELVVREDEIERAVSQFNEVLKLKLPSPIQIHEQPIKSSTDFEGGIEFVAPVDGEGPFASTPRGGIGPLVFEIEDFDEAKAWLQAHDYRIFYEYDSSQGHGAEASTAVRQLVLDPEQWFGFLVTLMERGRA